jgi:hypothetical protein
MEAIWHDPTGCPRKFWRRLGWTSGYNDLCSLDPGLIDQPAPTSRPIRKALVLRDLIEGDITDWHRPGGGPSGQHRQSGWHLRLLPQPQGDFQSRHDPHINPNARGRTQPKRGRKPLFDPQLVAGFDGSRRGLLYWYRNDAEAEPDSLHTVIIYATSGGFLA